jgi:hypothetical protein
MQVVRTDRQGSTVAFDAGELGILSNSLRWLLETLPDTRYGRDEFSA